MQLAVVGVVINIVISFIVAADPAMEGLSWFMFAAAALSAVGLAVAGSGERKTGAYMIIAGAVLFVPIGLVAAFGGRKILDELKLEAFNAGVSS
ncbi:MAG: hypothetical protein AAF721_40615 [Myxococcota bacterium]